METVQAALGGRGTAVDAEALRQLLCESFGVELSRSDVVTASDVSNRHDSAQNARAAALATCLCSASTSRDWTFFDGLDQPRDTPVDPPRQRPRSAVAYPRQYSKSSKSQASLGLSSEEALSSARSYSSANLSHSGRSENNFGPNLASDREFWGTRNGWQKAPIESDVGRFLNPFEQGNAETTRADAIDNMRVVETELQKLARAMDSLQRLSRRYVSLAARLGEHGNEVTPLDAYLHAVQHKDTAKALRDRIRHVKEERALYEELAKHLPEVQEGGAWQAYGGDEEEDANEVVRALEGLEAQLVQAAPSVERVRNLWTAAKQRVPAQALSRIMSSSKLRSQAKQLSRNFPSSKLQDEDATASERRAELEALCAAVLKDTQFKIV